jgi:RNA polymerase sigma-70 factor, ECF subfamily
LNAYRSNGRPGGRNAQKGETINSKRPVPIDPQIPTEPYTPGSTEDFDRLYRNAYPRVFRTLVAILADPAEAEDCAQDAFVHAFKAWNRWRPDAPAEAWVHRIAVNSAISYRRRARLRTVGELLRRLGRPSHGTDPAEVATQPDLLGALRTIPTRLAAAIVLRHYHGYNNREIAAALGVTERTVGTRLRQAGERLRAELGDAAFSAFPLDARRALSSRKEIE